jgi:hypothetical protein
MIVPIDINLSSARAGRLFALPFTVNNNGES